MIESDEDCLMIARQLHAVVKALCNAKTMHVKDHIEHCLEVAVKERNSSPPDISSFKEIAKYL